MFSMLFHLVPYTTYFTVCTDVYKHFMNSNHQQYCIFGPKPDLPYHSIIYFGNLFKYLTVSQYFHLLFFIFMATEAKVLRYLQVLAQDTYRSPSFDIHTSIYVCPFSTSPTSFLTSITKYCEYPSPYNNIRRDLTIARRTQSFYRITRTHNIYGMSIFLFSSLSCN